MSQTGATVLIVDDTPANLHLLAGMMKQAGYHVRVAPSGLLALQSIESSLPDIILVDINMPEMSGYALCEIIKSDWRWKHIPIIFISALDAPMDKVHAFAVGGVDYVTKPFDFPEVQARVATHLELARYRQQLESLVEAKLQEISGAQMATIYALAKLAESRDDDMGFHLERVSRTCEILAGALLKGGHYLAEVDALFVHNIYHSSVLHDIGKVAIPDAVLRKPGKLTLEEMAVMKEHSAIGAKTLQVAHQEHPQNAYIDMGIKIARSHHEKWDGSGYPDALCGSAIPVSARIMAVADVYDALRSVRCYKKAFTREESRAILMDGKGRHFDPLIIEVFMEHEDQIEEVYCALV